MSSNTCNNAETYKLYPYIEANTGEIKIAGISEEPCRDCAKASADDGRFSLPVIEYPKYRADGCLFVPDFNTRHFHSHGKPCPSGEETVRIRVSSLQPSNKIVRPGQSDMTVMETK